LVWSYTLLTHARIINGTSLLDALAEKTLAQDMQIVSWVYCCTRKWSSWWWCCTEICLPTWCEHRVLFGHSFPLINKGSSGLFGRIPCLCKHHISRIWKRTVTIKKPGFTVSPFSP
jgi:hypothetical protein